MRSGGAAVVIASGVVMAALASVHCGGGDSAAPTTDAGVEADLGERDAAVDAEEPPPPPTEGSGTRFRTIHIEQWWDDGTNVRLFSNFFDRKLGHPCRITEVGPDRFACMPDDIVDAYRGDTYSDAACTMPALGVTNADYARYVQWGPYCAPKLGRVGALKSGSVLYTKDPNTQECVATAIGVSTMQVPAEIPLDAFGTFTRTADATAYPGERSGSRLVLRADRFTGDDGSFEARAPRIVDLARNAAGEIGFGIDKKRRVFTSYRGVTKSSGAFTDQTCQTSTVFFERAPGVCTDDPFRPREAKRQELASDRSCMVSRIVTRPAGAPLTALYESVANTCRLRLSSSSPYVDTYPDEPLTEIAPEAFVAIEMQTVPARGADVVSGTALEARSARYTSADGLDVAMRSSKLYLRKYDLPCVQTFVGIGTSQAQRCIPEVPMTDGGAGALFADAACTKALARLLGRGACGAPDPAFYRTSSGTVSRLPPGSVLRPTSVYRYENGACVPDSPYEFEYIAADAGEPVASTEFPKLAKSELVIDR